MLYLYVTRKTKVVINYKDIKYFLVFFSKTNNENIIKTKSTKGILLPVIIKENRIIKNRKTKYE